METPPGFSRHHQWRIALHVGVSIASFAAIVVMVNYLGARHFRRWDWSRAGEARLTTRTLAVLGGLTNTVEVTLLYDPEAVLYGRVQRLLEEYRAASPRVEVRRVDYLRDPAAALQVRAQYRLPEAGNDNLVIFAYGDRFRVVPERELADIDFDQDFEDGQLMMRRRYRSFRGELMFTASLVSLTAPRPLRAYFLQNHGEHDPADAENPLGYGRFADVLTENNIRHAALKLGPGGKVPADCDLLVIAGPVREFLAEEVERIEQYLHQGGRVFLLFNISAVQVKTGLERLLGRWGVVVNPNVVVDEFQNTRGQAFMTSRFAPHPVVQPLRDTSLLVTWPRTVAAVDPKSRPAVATEVTELVFSSTNSLVLTEIRDGLPRETGRDYRGEAPLAAAVEKGGLPGVAADRGGVSRLVVVGDSYFLDNQLIGLQGNREFASLAVNWLLNQTELLAGIGARPLQEFVVNFTPGQLRAIRWTLIGLLPAGALGLGLVVWLRRRS